MNNVCWASWELRVRCLDGALGLSSKGGRATGYLSSLPLDGILCAYRFGLAFWEGVVVVWRDNYPDVAFLGSAVNTSSKFRADEEACQYRLYGSRARWIDSSRCG